MLLGLTGGLFENNNQSLRKLTKLYKTSVTEYYKIIY